MLIVAIIYDTLLSGRKAIELYQSLVERLGFEFQFELHLCKVEQMSDNSGARRHGTVENAHLIILALDKNMPFPAAVRDSLDELCGGSGEAGALALLLTGKEPGKLTDQIEAEASRIAELAGFDFFVSKATEQPEAPPPETEPSYIFVERGVEGWGIND